MFNIVWLFMLKCLWNAGSAQTNKLNIHDCIASQWSLYKFRIFEEKVYLLRLYTTALTVLYRDLSSKSEFFVSMKRLNCECQRVIEDKYILSQFVISPWMDRSGQGVRGRDVKTDCFCPTCCCSSAPSPPSTHTCSMRFHCCSYLLSEQLPTPPVNQLLPINTATQRHHTKHVWGSV